MAKKNQNKCVVTFKQAGSEIKVTFIQDEGEINYQTDLSKFAKDREDEVHFSNFLAGFFLATLSAWSKQESQKNASNEVSESEINNTTKN